MFLPLKRTLRFLSLLFIVCSTTTAATPETQPFFRCISYRLKCSVTPEQHSLEAEANISLASLASDRDTLEFSLNENFLVQTTSVNGKRAFSLINGPIGDDGRLYKLILADKLNIEDTVSLLITFAGSLDTAFEFGIISPRITELNTYANWFPSLSSTDYSVTKTDFSLTLPVTYEFTSTGLLITDYLSEGKRTKRWLNEGEFSLDFVVIASDIMKLEKVSPHRYIFYSDENERGELLKMIEYSTECINYYTTLYGPSRLRKDITIVSLPIDRKSTVAYYRSTLFVYTRSYLESGYASWQFNKTLFHEIAHFFWIITSSSVRPPDSWIDEGIAEYSAWLAVAHIFGNDYFYKCVEQASNTILKEPRVFLTHSAQDNYFYAFVPYIYHMLRFNLGDSLFFAMLKTLHPIIGTETETSPQAFVDSIQKFTSVPVGAFLGQWFSRDIFLILAFTVHQDSVGEDNYRVRVEITQQQSILFETPVVLLFRFRSGRSQIDRILIKERITSFSLSTRSEVERVDLNPDKSIIATIIKQ